jgi:hypothetical protein
MRRWLTLRALGFLLALLCLTGCSNKDKVPSGIIPPARMQYILWDMIQADQYANMYLTKDSVGVRSKQQTLTLYAQVFQMHKISREDFQKSFQYYIDRPDLSRSLLDSVLKLGNRDRATFTAMPAKTPPAKGASPLLPFHQFAKPGGQVPSGPPDHLPNGLPRGTAPGSPMQHPLPGSPAQRLHPPMLTHPAADSAHRSHVRTRHSADSSGHRSGRPFHISR